MNWLVDNWFIVLAFTGIVAMAITYIIKIVDSPTDVQIDNIKEWLKWAVVQAEKDLGSGTGQLKLRMVYNLAVEKFPFIIRIIAFETFSHWVDDALEWMNKQLESNVNMQNIVTGGDLN